ncbi:MAG: hypothetical protein HY902_19625 [Deltaproteobacteria bacterium]|nr:hypothetical protein [Deltaproteobacteria bacterium]
MPAAASVEGLLLSSGGGPAADGTYQITFALFAAATGGNPVWTEGPVAVSVKNGQMAYLMGSKTPLSAAALSLTTPYLSMQIGTDPELARQPLGASLYALRASVAEGLDCSGCIKSAMIDSGVLQPYAKTADLSAYAKTSDLGAYAKTTDLADYAKTASLAKVATSGKYSDLSGGPDLTPYAKTADLANYVQASSLAKVAGTGSYTDLTNTPTLAKVATTGEYADLKNPPGIPQVNKFCGTGLYMKGYNSDGSVNCQKLVEGDMPGDGIDEVSNGLIYNQFVDSTPGSADVVIKDGLVAGVSDTLTFPDIGLAQKISVTFNATNSDVSKLVVDLYGPGLSTPYSLYAGGKTGTTLSMKFNDTDAIVKGDMNADWLGKNIKGAWSIVVKDTLQNVGGGADGKYNWSINIQTLSNKKIQIKGDLIVDGNVSFAKTPTIPGTPLDQMPGLEKFKKPYTGVISLRAGVASKCPAGWTSQAVGPWKTANNYVYNNIMSSGFYSGGVNSHGYGQQYLYWGYDVNNIGGDNGTLCYHTYTAPAGNPHTSIVATYGGGAEKCPSGYAFFPHGDLKGNNDYVYSMGNKAGFYLGYVDTWDYNAQNYNEDGAYQYKYWTSSYATGYCVRTYGTTEDADPNTQRGVFPVFLGFYNNTSGCPSGFNLQSMQNWQGNNGYYQMVVNDNLSTLASTQANGWWSWGSDNGFYMYAANSQISHICWKYFAQNGPRVFADVRMLYNNATSCPSGYYTIDATYLKNGGAPGNSMYYMQTGHGLYIGGLNSWSVFDYSNGYVQHSTSSYTNKVCLKISNAL